ncbi:MAG: hypothetical protein HY820_27705 [Acidobacteria bacterium]|nr:hypothetical protein [Acidobacteriota bacterium]
MKQTTSSMAVCVLTLALIPEMAIAQRALQLRGPSHGWNQSSVRARREPLRIEEERDGSTTVLQRIRSAGGATRVRFERFALPQDAKVFVYGLDGNQQVTLVAGPYTSSGPLGSSEFWSRAVPGIEVVVELQGMRAGAEATLASLPFEITETADAGGIEEGAWDTEAANGRRTSYWNGMIVEHAVRGGYGVFEGDILMGREEELERAEKAAGRESVSRNSGRWPGGIVPYVIDAAFPNPALVQAAISHWNTNLSGYISLVPRTTQSAYLLFRADANAGSCSSYVGYTGMAAQPVNLGAYCSTGNAIHEIGHAIGFYHEHTRTDRNTYVVVNTANIDPNASYNFTMCSNCTNGGAYDYGSIMHYPAYAFSINSLPTIETIPAGIAIGQRSGLSAGDIAWAKVMYPTGTPTGGGVSLTLASNPTGRTLLLDSIAVTAPYVSTVTAGSTHSVSAPNTTVGGTQYAFSRWSDGGAQTHNITAPTSNSTLTATYRTRYLLTRSSSDATKGSLGATPASSDGFYDAGSTVTLNSIPVSGNCLTGWGGVLAVTDTRVSVTMNQSYAVQGIFQTGAVSVPAAVSAPSTSGTTAVPVTATSGCIWRASSNSSWISISQPTGRSSASLTISLSRNNTKSSRTGSIVVNGQTTTVTQAGR